MGFKSPIVYNSPMKVVTDFGRVVDSDKYLLANKYIDLKNSKNPWEVMDFIVQSWIETRPREYQSIVIDILETKDSTYNDFGESKVGNLRRTIDLPIYVERVFRILYKDTDFVFDKNFYRKIWKRYPIFRVSVRS